jgi:ribosomal protein S18 acetylase RimI-like enzyme
MPQVRSASPAERESVLATIVLAFSTDPMARWVWPDAPTYHSSMPEFTIAFGGAAFDHGSAHLSGNFAAAALWLPPGIEPDRERMGEISAASSSPRVLEEIGCLMERVATMEPSEPHWYLPLIGVDPAHQGQGHGSALLAHAAERFDREGALAVLESSNPRNIALYQRHGFRVLGEAQYGSSPKIVPMVREPRR